MRLAILATVMIAATLPASAQSVKTCRDALVILAPLEENIATHVDILWDLQAVKGVIQGAVREDLADQIIEKRADALRAMIDLQAIVTDARHKAAVCARYKFSG